MSEAWSQWQGQLIDGKFHLKQYLGGSGESGVFFAQLSSDFHTGTESEQPVAIRLIADSANAELQLSRWRMAQGLSHPHLLQIIDTGRCRLGVIDLIYAVMEYAEENLAQIIPERPLSVEETRQMLGPALDALSYLHGIGLVHGHLKPSHIMAIADELKLTTDGICPADQPVTPSEQTDASSMATVASTQTALEIHNAPETRCGSWSPASDVWSLGVTLAEVLTRHSPIANEAGQSDSDPLLPEKLPIEFVEIVRGCLRRDLRLRWTIPAIRARLAQPAATPVPAASSATPVVDSSATELPSVAAATTATSETIEPPTTTFAQALRAKPVASEKKAVPQKPLVKVAAASAQGSSVMTPEPEAPYHLPISLVPKRAGQSSSAMSPFSDIVTSRGLNGTADKPSVDKSSKNNEGAEPSVAEEQSAILARAPAIPGKALHSAVISQAASVIRRIVGQTTVALRRLGSQLGQTVLGQTVPRLGSQVRNLLGPYPSRKLQSLGLAAVVMFTAVTALYVGVGQLRHKKPKPAAQTTTPSPKVIIAHSSQKPSSKKRPSASAKPHPGTPQSQAEPAAPARTQSPATPSAVSEGPQPAVSHSQPDAQPIALRSGDDGIRHIDDGGAEDNAVSEPTARVSRNNVAPKSANSALAVDGVQQILPDVSRAALHTIHGTVRVNVRVRVDHSGNVAGAELASSGPSRYFARKSLEAAQNWKFAPGQGVGSPVVVHFEFTNNGTRAFATRLGS